MSRGIEVDDGEFTQDQLKTFLSEALVLLSSFRHRSRDDLYTAAARAAYGQAADELREAYDTARWVP